MLIKCLNYKCNVNNDNVNFQTTIKPIVVMILTACHIGKTISIEKLKPHKP